MSFDRKLSIGLFLFSSLVLYLSINIPKTAIRQTVGPEVMPIGIALALMLSSVALYVRSIRLEAAGSPPAPTLPGGAVSEDWVTQGLVLAGIAAYMFLLEPLGFVAATTLFCFYEASVFELKHWIRNLLVAAAFSAVVYTLFVKFLEVLLPAGLLSW